MLLERIDILSKSRKKCVLKKSGVNVVAETLTHPSATLGLLVRWFVGSLIGSLVLVGLGLRLSLFDLSYSSEGKVSSPNWTDVCGRLYFADFIIAFCVFIKFFRKKKT